jgi:ribosomal protein S27AE
VDGGPGNDVINVHNQKKDYVRCGKGRDRVVADHQDRLNGCERVARRK